MGSRRRVRRISCAAVESLEIRRLLATFVVNTLDDDNMRNMVTSLREAIAQADDTSGDDVITFDPTVFAAGSQHVITPLGEPLHVQGLKGKLTITGPGSAVLAIDGSQAGRSFDIEASADVTLSGVSIVNGIGAGLGGGIRNLGTLTLSSVMLNNNQVVGLDDAADGNATLAGSDGADLTGGAIYSSGSLTMSDCTLTGNFVRGQNGGNSTFGGGNGGDGLGAAIYADGPITFTNCQFIDNVAQGGKAGQKTGADADAASGDGLGGAIYLASNAHGSFENVGLSNNAALGGTGATASGAHHAGDGGNGSGGALYSLASMLNITDSLFDSNLAIGGTPGDPGISGTGGNGGEAVGGAIWSQSNLTIARSTLTNNSANAADPDPTVVGIAFASPALGGAMFLSGSISILDSTIDHNGAFGAFGIAGAQGGFATGAGIYLLGSLNFDNSTLYGNTATGGNGGDSTVAGDGGAAHGGGITCDNVNAFTALNSTIASNAVAGGTGGSGTSPGADGDASGGGVYGGDIIALTNTIVADNTSSTAFGPDIFDPGLITLINCLVTSPGESGYNLDLPASQNNVSGPANLGALADNGGPTNTVLPQSGSAAIDAGDSAAAIAAFGANGTDQRGTGFARINGAAVDIGSLETPAIPALTLLGNGLTIANGDDSPRTADNTAFGTTKAGTPIDKTFTIRNDGGGPLNLGAISLPGGFSMTKPYAATVAPGATTTFTLRFNPAIPTSVIANVEIADNEASGHFDFVVSATADGAAFRVNFQPAASEVPLGYLADFGSVFGARGNGFSYGWNAAIATGTRQRNVLADQARDTLVHTQMFGARTWEVTVPNGTYTVHVVAGDPSFTNSVYKVSVEGVLTVNGTPTNANHFVEGTKTVTVTDGKLTISNASGAVNNKIDYVEIAPVYNINFQPAGATVPSGYLADTGAVFGGRANGLSYGWNQSASTAARDRNSKLSADQQHDTFIHTQLSGNRSWELALANGYYSVHIVAGDPDFFDSVYQFAAEGNTVVSGTPTSGKHWIEGTATVLVQDGKLTITNASGAVNNKIDYIDITALAPPTIV